MECTPSTMKPQELIEFKKLNGTENVEIPVQPEDRTLTDKQGLILFGIALLILVPFLVCSLTKSDLRYLSYPTDDCANFCGFNNTRIENVNCSGRDNSEKPYLDGNGWTGFWCSKSCKNSKEPRDYVCLSESDASRYHHRRGFEDVTVIFHYVLERWWKFIIAVIITIVLSLSALMVMRFAPALLVWTSYILAMLLLISGTVCFWCYTTMYIIVSENTKMWIYFGIIWSVICVVLLTTFLVLLKKIALVIQLYREAAKVLAAMPQLVLVSMVTTFMQFLILGIFFTTTLRLVFSYDILFKHGVWIDGVASLDRVSWHYSPATIFTYFFNLIVTIWVMRFISGIQYMIISSSTSIWYFDKNKEYLDSPILTSIKVTTRYHLGTILFASFLFMLFSGVQTIIKPLCRIICCRCFTVKCCPVVEVGFNFVSENSYIETGIHGQSFLESTKRATKLLMANARNTIAISCMGSFVLVVMEIVLIIIFTVLSVVIMFPPLEDLLIPVSICFVMNLIIIWIMFSTFKTIIDTLFICFYEDCVLNDGISKPYCTPKGFVEFIENSKKLYGCNQST